MSILADVDAAIAETAAVGAKMRVDRLRTLCVLCDGRWQSIDEKAPT